MAAFEGSYRNFRVAHQMLEQIRPQDVIGAHMQPAENGQTPFVDRPLPTIQFPKILAEGRADVTDCAHPKTHEIRVGVSRIAHEVAMKRAALLSQREFVVRQCKVIHADISVATCHELADCEHE